MRLSNILAKQTTISLIRTGEEFWLQASCDDRPCEIGRVLERWPEAEIIRAYFPHDDMSSAEVHPQNLSELLDCFQEIQDCLQPKSRLRLQLDPGIAQLQFSEDPPANFLIRWVWGEGALHLCLPPDTAELANGWYRFGACLWQYSALSSRQLERLRHPCIKQNDLPYFLSKELPALRDAGVHAACDLAYSTEPAMDLEFTEITPECLCIQRKWNVPEDSISSTVILPGHVLSGNIVRPGLTPEQLNAMLPWEGDVCRLAGASIPQFLDDAFHRLRAWLHGDFSALQSMHRWIVPPFSWVLTASSRVVRGVGRAQAVPTACVGEDRLSAEELLKCLSQPYARLKGGWVRRRDLCTLGMNANLRLSDGTSLAPIRLSTAQLLYRGDESLAGPWLEIRCAGMPWRASSSRRAAALEHLEYLMYWGIHGGLTGGYASAAVYGPDMLASLFQRAPDARVLIVGREQDLRDFSTYCSNIPLADTEAYDAERHGQAYLLSYERMARNAVAQAVEWDVLISIEPDALGLSAADMRNSALFRLRAACRIGFFLYDPDLCPGERKSAQALFLNIPRDDALSALLIREPLRPLRLPSPCVLHPTPVAAVSETDFLPATPASEISWRHASDEQ